MMNDEIGNPCKRCVFFTMKVILLYIFQCLVDEVHAPQSLWIEKI